MALYKKVPLLFVGEECFHRPDVDKGAGWSKRLKAGHRQSGM